jgi:uncharacterized membrane protein
MKVVFLALVVLISSAAAGDAASVTFSNSLDLRIALTVTYTDADSGVLTTRGWWHVEPGGQTVVTVNADESAGIYYAAYNKVVYFDSTTRQNPQINRWACYRTFTYTSDAEPDDDDVWLGRFFKINGNSVNINE